MRRVLTAATAHGLRLLGGVHVWWWDLPDQAEPDDLALLDTAEFEQALRLPVEQAAAGFIRTRASARRALGSLLGLPPHTVGLAAHLCGGCGDTHHGPPYVTRPQLPVPMALSMSCSDRRGVLVVRPGTRVGVHVVAVRPLSGDGPPGGVLTESEHRLLRSVPPGPERDRLFHRCRARKQAVAQALGRCPAELELSWTQAGPAAPAPVRITHMEQGRTTVWSVDDLDVGKDFAAAVACPSGRPHGPLRRPFPVRPHRPNP